MKIVWKGSWRKGDISLETESPEELIDIFRKLESVEPLSSVLGEAEETQISSVEKPSIPGSLGPSEAIRQALNTSWGRAEPRTMNEMVDVLETNAIYFSKSTISGVLTNMTKKGELRRLKKGNVWAYVLSS